MLSIGTVYVILTTVLVAISWLLTKLYPLYQTWQAQRKALDKLPKLNQNHWLLGSLPQFKRPIDFLNAAVKAAREGHKVLGLWRSNFQGQLVILHPDSAQQILRGVEPKATRMKTAYSLIEKWLGAGLITAHGPHWERSRKLLTPGFHFSVLKAYMKVFNDAAGLFLKNMEQQQKMQKSVDVADLVTLSSLDVVLQCAFSYKGEVQATGEMHPYARSGKRIVKLIMNRVQKPIWWIDAIYGITSEGKEFNGLCDYVHKFAEDIIDERTEALRIDPNLTKKRHLDFLDILLTARDEDGIGLSRLDIRQEVDTFLFAGHDTTSSAITWMIYSLSQYPEMQERVRQEVKSITQGREDVEWNDLSKLVYSTKFIHEVLRFYGPVPAIGRQLTKDTVFDGVVVPAKTLIFISLYAIHHNPFVWDKPEEFKPERFDLDTFADRHAYLFVPFSAGPRNCIGQNFALHEIKVMLCRIVKRFTVEADPDFKPALLPEGTMRSSNGVRVKLKLRT